MLKHDIDAIHSRDPTTGQIRADSKDDIACWFIDMNYNDKSFSMRHTYFTTGDNSYRTLRFKYNQVQKTWQVSL